MKKSCLSFVLGILFPLWIAAASDGFRFRHFTVENGLLSNAVRAVLQDKYGFMWFGTDEGLNCYDGIRVRSYKLCKQGEGRYVASLYDAGDCIWIGTEEGLFVYSYETGRFTPFCLRTNEGTAIQKTVTSIAGDKDGNLWFSTTGQGVFRYTPGTESLEQYPFAESKGLVASVMVDSENQIWGITNWGNPTVSWLNKVKNSFEPFPLGYEGKKHRSGALVMLEDSEHTYWLGTWECGLQKIDKYTGKVTVYLHPEDGKGAMHIHSLMEYAPHQLLVGSDDGLLLFNTVSGESRLYTEDETDPHSLSNRFVYPLLKDREGGVWAGTFYGGVNYIAPHSGQFESYMHSRFSNSVNGTVIGRFCEDAHGRIWIASDDGGLSCFTPQTRHFTHYLPEEGRNSLSYHNVHALCMDGDDLWIGTYTGGVNVLDTRTGRFRYYTSSLSDSTTLDGSSAYAIFKDREERIWVTSMSGINLYDREEDCFIRVRDLGALTIDIDQDVKGDLWFSTQGKGMFKYHPDTHSWKNYTSENTSGGLMSNQVNCTLVDYSGTLWVGTMDGLSRYDEATDRFEVIPLDIPSRNICGIVEEQHILWLTTSRGLVKYTPGAGCRIFTKSDGLLSDQFLANAILKSSCGKIYIGSVKGFNVFYPYQIRTNGVCPSVAITGLEIFNREVAVGDSRLPQAIGEMKQLELSHKETVFSLSFASLSYCMPEKNQYAYRLDGFDKEWNLVGTQHKASYTNLSPGTYLFRVKATNNDGLWSEQETQLKIIIHPPFYFSTGFKILYVLLACVLVAFLLFWILHRAEKRHNEEINLLNATKEKEVHEAKIKFFTMIAHEIRTPVSLIIGPLEKVLKSPLPAVVQADLKIIDRNCQRLLFLVNQLLDFRKVEQEGLRIKYTRQNICQLLEAVAERFEPYITQMGASFKVEYPSPDFTAMVDSEALTKLISNLLTNANKYTRDEVILSCTVQAEQHTFVIRVTDNGIGISREEQKKIFQPFYQAMDNKPGTGIGLSLVKSIVELHNGSIEVLSEVGRGSSFIVTLPIEQASAAGQEKETDMLDHTVLPEDILVESLPVVAPQKNKPLMLIVDDNEEMRSFLSGSFSERFSILTAADGIEALECLKEQDVTLIVSDWMMPRLDGVEFCKAVRSNQATSHIPFILLTAKTDLNSKIEGMDCGADAYIEKPFSVQYLDACIKNLVDLRILLRQKFSRMPMVPLNSIASNTVDDDFLSRMNDIIEQNFSNSELTVDFLAERLCISRSGLFAKIKQLAGSTPNELIQLVRLKKAAILLKENKYRISEICYKVGFNNPSYFAKCFHKQFGVKPGEFACQKEEPQADVSVPEPPK